jgi:hypothetical protein
MKNQSDSWTELCALVANESDPKKLSEHLDRLIKALDARKKENVKYNSPPLKGKNSE